MFDDNQVVNTLDGNVKGEIDIKGPIIIDS